MLKKRKKGYCTPTQIRQRDLILIKGRTHFYGLCLCAEHIPLPTLVVTGKNSRLKAKKRGFVSLESNDYILSAI